MSMKDVICVERGKFQACTTCSHAHPHNDHGCSRMFCAGGFYPTGVGTPQCVIITDYRSLPGGYQQGGDAYDTAGSN